MIFGIDLSAVSAMDWLNIISFGLTILGFFVTTHAARRAAYSAERAVKEINKFNVATKLSEVQGLIEFLRTMNRSKISRESLLYNYGSLARSISEYKNNDLLNSVERKFFSDFLLEIREFESSLEMASSNPKEFDFIAVNQRLALHFDNIISVVKRIEQQ